MEILSCINEDKIFVRFLWFFHNEQSLSTFLILIEKCNIVRRRIKENNFTGSL